MENGLAVKPQNAAHDGWMRRLQERIADYDALEVHPVKDLFEKNERGETCCEVCTPEEADFWSVYGHLWEGGVECIEDFENKSDAEEFAENLKRTYPHLQN